MLTNNKGRLISLDVFFAGNQPRLAAAWVSNTGNQNQAWWWNPNVHAATLGQMLTDNKGRLVVLEPFVVNDQLRLAAVWVSNVGPDGQAWWWNPDVDAATLADMLDTNKGRLISLDPFVVGGSVRFAAAWLQNTGSTSKTWWWYHGVDATWLGKKFNQFCSYPIELRTYSVGSTRKIASVMNSYPEGADPEGAKLVNVTGAGSLDSLTNNIARWTSRCRFR